MIEKKNEIISELENDLQIINTSQDLIELKAKYLGKKGLVTVLTSNMKDLSVEERKEVGMVVNELRTIVTEKINKLDEKIRNKELCDNNIRK